MKDDLGRHIEAILFYRAEPVDISELAKILEVKEAEIQSALENLSVSLKERGIRLVQNQKEVELATAPEESAIIEKMIKEERERDLGRASMETLSIVAYKGPVSRKEIEYIRGVNSQFALRNLLIRGLIQRTASALDERIGLYSMTGEALLHLGLSRIEDLPEWNEVRKQLEVKEEGESDEESEQ